METDRHRRMAFEHAVARAPISGRARQTGLVLAHFMSKDGVTWVGQRRLAHHWGIRYDRWKKDIAEIVAAGLVEVTARVGERGSSSYRSRARFVSQTSADIVLENGSILSAASAPSETLTGGAASAPSETLTGGAASPFSASASPFSASASAPSETNHPTTTPPSGGGGGGGAVPAAASASATAAGPAEGVVRSSIDAVIERLSELVDGKAVVPRFDRRLRDAVAAKLEAGWEPASLAAVLMDNGLPKHVGNPAAFWLGRVEGVAIEPVVVLLGSARNGGDRVSEQFQPVETAIRPQYRTACDDDAADEDADEMRDIWLRMVWATMSLCDRDFAAKELSIAANDAFETFDLFENAGEDVHMGMVLPPREYPAPMVMYGDCVSLAPWLRGDLLGSSRSVFEQSPGLRQVIETCPWSLLLTLVDRLGALTEDDDGNLTEMSVRLLKGGGPASISSLWVHRNWFKVWDDDEPCLVCGALTFCDHRHNGGAGTAERA